MGKYSCFDLRKGRIRDKLELEIDDPKYSGEKVDRKNAMEDAESSDLGSEPELDFSDDSLDLHPDDGSDKMNFDTELNEMQREEEDMIKSLSASASKDLKKGIHLKNQMVIT